MEAVEQPWFVPQKVLLLLKLKLQNNQDALQPGNSLAMNVIIDNVRCEWNIFSQGTVKCLDHLRERCPLLHLILKVYVEGAGPRRFLEIHWS